MTIELYSHKHFEIPPPLDPSSDFLLPAENWFEAKYAACLERRLSTMRLALRALLAGSGPDRVVVETGCVRKIRDYAAGYSTVLFAEILDRYGGRLHTVDLDAQNMEFCRTITTSYAMNLAYYVDDSVSFLRNWPAVAPGKSIDLLYLDSYDFPQSPEQGHPGPAQAHCLAELQAALPNLSPNAVVLFDDAALPHGGKPALACRLLMEIGWHHVHTDYQSLWSKTAPAEM